MNITLGGIMVMAVGWGLMYLAYKKTGSKIVGVGIAIVVLIIGILIFGLRTHEGTYILQPVIKILQ